MSTKKINPSIKLDRVQASDYLKYNFRHACEHCSHFDDVKILCTIGCEHRPHLYEEQMKTFHLTGRMALCRFLEID